MAAALLSALQTPLLPKQQRGPSPVPAGPPHCSPRMTPIHTDLLSHLLFSFQHLCRAMLSILQRGGPCPVFAGGCCARMLWLGPCRPPRTCRIPGGDVRLKQRQAGKPCKLLSRALSPQLFFVFSSSLPFPASNCSHWLCCGFAPALARSWNTVLEKRNDET